MTVLIQVTVITHFFTRDTESGTWDIIIRFQMLYVVTQYTDFTTAISTFKMSYGFAV